MTRVRLRVLCSRASALMCALMLLSVCAAVPADAQATSAEPFVQPEYYLGIDNEPPTLDAFFADPRRYLRSETAYTQLRAYIAARTGRAELSEADFLALFAAGKVRAKLLCLGAINTAGILPSETLAWRVRDCYTDERLIEVQHVTGRWVVVASQGCFNPVRPIPMPTSQLTACTWVCRPNNQSTLYPGTSLEAQIAGGKFIRGLTTSPYIDQSRGQTCRCERNERTDR